MHTNDFALAPLGDEEYRNFQAICNDRYRLRSTVLPSQLSPDRSRLDAGQPRALHSPSGTRGLRRDLEREPSAGNPHAGFDERGEET